MKGHTPGVYIFFKCQTSHNTLSSTERTERKGGGGGQYTTRLLRIVLLSLFFLLFTTLCLSSADINIILKKKKYKTASLEPDYLDHLILSYFYVPFFQYCFSSLWVTPPPTAIKKEQGKKRNTAEFLNILPKYT